MRTQLVRLVTIAGLLLALPGCVPIRITHYETRVSGDVEHLYNIRRVGGNINLQKASRTGSVVGEEPEVRSKSRTWLGNDPLLAPFERYCEAGLRPLEFDERVQYEQLLKRVFSNPVVEHQRELLGRELIAARSHHELLRVYYATEDLVRSHPGDVDAKILRLRARRALSQAYASPSVQNWMIEERINREVDIGE